MGWICSRCGAENQFEEHQCMACGKQAFILTRIGGAVKGFFEKGPETTLSVPASENIGNGTFDRILTGFDRGSRVILCIAASMAVCFVVITAAAGVQKGSFLRDVQKRSATITRSVKAPDSSRMSAVSVRWQAMGDASDARWYYLGEQSSYAMQDHLERSQDASIVLEKQISQDNRIADLRGDALFNIFKLTMDVNAENAQEHMELLLDSLK